VRKAVGTDYPVWVRLNGQEYGIEDGVTIQESRQVAKMVVDAGAQAIHVSAYGAGSYASKAPLTDTPGYFLPLAESIKKVVSRTFIENLNHLRQNNSIS
jgi:2,4-dienoyl-CoA reductase-like NADH-dependent reductase (Old Yellow Enzyme family)